MPFFKLDLFSKQNHKFLGLALFYSNLRNHSNFFNENFPPVFNSKKKNLNFILEKKKFFSCFISKGNDLKNSFCYFFFLNNPFLYNKLTEKFSKKNEKGLFNETFFLKEKWKEKILIKFGDFFLFIARNKHKGCLDGNFKVFLENSRFVEILTKRFFSEKLIEIFQRNGILQINNWKCGQNFLKKKKIICKFKDFFFFKKKSLNEYSKSVPPCLNCQFLNECNSQSLINPFNCIFLKSWEKKM